MGGVTVVAVGNSASVVKADLLFNRGRGVAHKINAVLLPVAL